MVDRSEYKRRQAPPGIKISTKAFGRDRRLPITNRYVSRVTQELQAPGWRGESAPLHSRERVTLLIWIAALALPLVGLIVLLAAPAADGIWSTTRRTSGSCWPRRSERGARTVDERHRAPPRRRAPVPRLARVPVRRRLPGAARPDARRARQRAQPGLHDRHLGRAAGGVHVRGRLGAAATARRAQWVIRNAQVLRGGVLVLLAAWAALSLGSVPPLDDPTPAERASGGLVGAAAVSTVLYAFAGWRYGDGHPQRLNDPDRGGERVCAAGRGDGRGRLRPQLARQLVEWHILMLLAFGAIAWSARREEGEERFSDLYLDDTAAGQARRERPVRGPAGVHALLGGTRSARGVRDAERVPAHRDPADRRPPRRRDRPALGDAIMATWGTRDQPEHARQAGRAASSCSRRLHRLADEHPAGPLRAGVNSGEAMVGVLGAESGAATP